MLQTAKPANCDGDGLREELAAAGFAVREFVIEAGEITIIGTRSSDGAEIDASMLAAIDAVVGAHTGELDADGAAVRSEAAGLQAKAQRLDELIDKLAAGTATAAEQRELLLLTAKGVRLLARKARLI